MKTRLLSLVLGLCAVLQANAQQLIGLGTTANDGTGDNLRAAGIKINTNVVNLYASNALLYATETTRNAAVSNAAVAFAMQASNDVYTAETTRNAAVSNGNAAFVMTLSNTLYSTETTRNATVSNGAVALAIQASNDVYTLETTRNAAVSNANAAFSMTVSNALASLELTRNAAVSNACVTFGMAVSNDVYTLETTRNASVSNAAVAFGMTVSNTIYTTETTRNAAVSNALVAFTMTASNTLYSQILGGGSIISNYVVLAANILHATNGVWGVVTNAGTNAALTFDLSGPSKFRSALSGPQTISLTNLPAVNGPWREWDLEIYHTGISGSALTITPIGSRTVNPGGLGFLELASGQTNFFKLIDDGTNLVMRSGQALPTGGGHFVASNAPSLYAPKLLNATASRALVSGPDQIPTNSVVTATELANLSGVTGVSGSGALALTTGGVTTNRMALTPTNVNPALIGSTTFLPGSGSATVAKPAAASVLATNLIGLVHKAVASVVEFDMNSANFWSVTNRAAAAMSFILTNGATGQSFSITALGEASGGSSRAVTFIAHTGQLIADLDTFGTALGTSKAVTLTNGNALEVSGLIERLNGTNVIKLVTRQFAF